MDVSIMLIIVRPMAELCKDVITSFSRKSANLTCPTLQPLHITKHAASPLSEVSQDRKSGDCKNCKCGNNVESCSGKGNLEGTQSLASTGMKVYCVAMETSKSGHAFSIPQCAHLHECHLGNVTRDAVGLHPVLYRKHKESASCSVIAGLRIFL